MRVTDAIVALTSLLLLEKNEFIFAATQVAPQDLSVLIVVSTAAAQQEYLFYCLAFFSKPSQVKVRWTEHLHMACKDAVSAFKSQECHRTQNINECLPAATAVVRAV